MLPELLLSEVSYTKELWENSRRQEILRLFEEHVYGITPKEAVDSVGGNLIQQELLHNGTVVKETVYLELKRDGKRCGFNLRIYSPKHQSGPLPAVIMINPFSRNKELDYPGKEMDHMPYDMITSEGFIGVHGDVDELCFDDADHYQEGLWNLFEPEGDTAWGAIGMWAFAASRIIDYLQMREDVNCDKIAVCGCSRAGKAALWCAAQDQRVALVISNVSGCTGAAVTRGKTGEHIKDITSRFPHWMCRTYSSYADDEEKLPLDQHMLLALCAPRPIYVSSASEDVWADPLKEFESAKLTEAVYQLYGRSGLGDLKFPAADCMISNGYIGYHMRSGIHGCRRYDWEQYLIFMKKFLI